MQSGLELGRKEQDTEQETPTPEPSYQIFSSVGQLRCSYLLNKRSHLLTVYSSLYSQCVDVRCWRRAYRKGTGKCDISINYSFSAPITDTSQELLLIQFRVAS